MTSFEQRKQREEVRRILAAVKEELAKSSTDSRFHSAGAPPVRLNEVIGRAWQLTYETREMPA